MANVYVRSGAGGAGTGADWANAYTTLAAACTAKLAGDIFYVAADHAETQASAMTITAPGTVGTPNRIICVDHTGTVPPVSADLRTTATISTTGANAITISGFFYCYGIIFQANSAGASGGGNIALSNNGAQPRFDSCVFRVLSTATSSIVGGAGASMYWNNCSVRFGAAGSSISLTNTGLFVWSNSPSAVDAAGTLPTTLLLDPARACRIELDAVDLSALSAKTVIASTGFPVKYLLTNCKLPASVTITATQAGGLGRGDVTVINCDSGAVNYRNERHNYAGDQTTETTIVRTGGATDGTTPVAFKVITTANSRWADPFTCIPIATWNETTGSSVTATVYGIWGGGAVPNKEDIWIDVEYLGSALTPQGSYVSSGNADILATAACDTDGTSTWGGSTTAFKMAVAFTPQMKGLVRVFVRCAKASSTFYIDPKVVLT
jgi:hypothetical protein